MGSTLDFLGATIADALSPRFRRPVEDIIYETIDRKQIPTRTDFTELRNTINSLRSQSTGAQKGIEKLKSGLDDIEESIHDLTTRLSDLEAKNKRLQTENESLKANASSQNTGTGESSVDLALLSELVKRVETLEAKAEKSFVTKTKSAKSSQVCKVEGCNKPVRASGFCNSHYGKCRRGTLPGFVSFAGEATVSSGAKIKVEKSFGGMAFTEKEGKILIDANVVATW